MKTKTKKKPRLKVLPPRRGPGRPPKADEDKVRRVVCYLEPRFHEALVKRAGDVGLELSDYAKKSLTRLAQSLLGEKVEADKS